MCADGAGEVVELGPGVTRVAIGDRVAAAMFPRWLGGRIDWEYASQLGGSFDGMLTDFNVLHEDALVRIPEHLRSKRERRCPARRLPRGMRSPAAGRFKPAIWH